MRYDRRGENGGIAAMGMRVIARTWPGVAGIVAVALMAPASSSAQTAQTGQATPPAAAPSREALQQQLDAQNARNEALRQRIAKLEEMLKTDVCNNPEAEALLKAEQQVQPR
jgi:hypothetical protein